jgi:hypothetical protein
MPTASEEHGPANWPLPTRIFHSYKAMTMVLAAAFSINYLSYPLGLPWSLVALLGGSFLGAVIILSVVWHTQKLCERCMEKVPADAENQASRLRRGLWLAHQTLFAPMPKLLMVAATIMVLSSIVNVAIDGWEFRWIAHIPVDLFVLTVVYMGWMHGRYRPWCPYCKGWDDDGPKEVVPEPDPVIEKEKVR